MQWQTAGAGRRAIGVGRNRVWERSAALLVAFLALLAVTPAPRAAARADAAVGAPVVSRQAAATAFGKIPLAFEANQGQADAATQFLTHGRAFSLALAPDALTLTVGAPQTPTDNQPRAGRVTAALRFGFAGANPDPALTAEEPLPGIVNYFIGNDPAHYHTNIPTSARVRYHDLYPGIDVVVYGSERGNWEYDVIVAPGADPTAMALAISGATGMTLDAATGDLVLPTAAGEVRQHAPVLYQDVDGTRQPISGSYVIRADGTLGFTVGQYDRTRPLTIDPEIIAYSTYDGGTGTDVANGIALDSAGDALIVGTTDGNFPTTNGNGFPPQYMGGSAAFVTKLNTNGTTRLYSTYLGGSGFDGGNAIAVDNLGNAYVTGTTAGPFPITVGPPCGCNTSGASDVFVTKLNPSGTALVYSTYLGVTGVGGGIGHGIAVDGTGNAYVTGEADSGLPVTNGYQTTASADGVDAFLTELNPTGSAAVYGSYLGGAAGTDVGYGVAVSGVGTAYITGSTNSTNFPTKNAFQGTLRGTGNAFVAKFNTTSPGASSLVYSTFLGGSGDDAGKGIAVDSMGNAYVTGNTNSMNFPVSAGSYQTMFGGGVADAFVVKLNPAGTALIYGAYLGGGTTDNAQGIAVDANGDAYVTGVTGGGFPTFNAAQTTFGGGGNDAFVAEVNAAGTALILSTYLGGTGNDVANGIAIAPDPGDTTNTHSLIFVAGRTSGMFPIQVNGVNSSLVSQPTYGGGTSDAFVAKLLFKNAAPTINQPMDQTVSINSGAHTVNLTGITQGAGESGQTITVTASSNNPTLIANPTITYTSPNATGTLTYSAAMNQGGMATITVTVMDNGGTANGGVDTTTVQFTITVNKATPTFTVTNTPNPSTYGQSVTFTATVATPTGVGVTPPTGSVAFMLGATTLCTATLTGGSGMCATSAIPVGGNQTITWTYSGDSLYNGAMGTVTQTVTQATPTVSVSGGPGVFGQAVTITATVTGVNNTTPTGIVTFTSGALMLGSGTLTPVTGMPNVATATVSPSNLPAGMDMVTASYGGDMIYAMTSGMGTVTINATTATIAVTSSSGMVNPTSVYGEQVTFTATVTGVMNTPPTGTVIFSYTPMGGTPTQIGMPVTLMAAGPGMPNVATAQITTMMPLPVGSLTITAKYTGDTNYQSGNNTLIQQVNKANTTTMLSIMPASPSVFGQQLTLTATVSVTPPGAGTPTNTVTFQDVTDPINPVTLGGGPVMLTGTTATLTVNTLSVGAHTLAAVYNGDTNFNTSTATGSTVTVNKANTTTTASVMPNPATAFGTITLGAQVTVAAPGGGTPTGSVTFTITPMGGGMATQVGPVNIDPTGKASATTTRPAGTYTITAAYSGDGNYMGSDSTAMPITETVNKATPGVTVTSSSGAMNPTSAVGANVTFTATVAGVTGGAAPGGTVTFSYTPMGGMPTPIGTPVTLTPGAGMSAATATASISTTTLPLGTLTITATYSGDGNYLAGTPGTVIQTVGKIASTVSVTGAPNPAAQGVSVTLTATVSGPAMSGTPTGSVVFTSGGTMLGMGMLDVTGKTSVTTTALPIGMDIITASYNGDATFLAGMGMTTETVTNPAVTMLTATAPTGMGSGNSGTANMPRLAAGGSFTLNVTGSYTNGSMGSVSGLMFVSNDAMKVSVDASGTIRGIAAGTATITVTAPNGVTTMITVTVPTAGAGLMNPNPQPMTHAAVATDSPTPNARPNPAPSGNGSSNSGAQPQAVVTPAATPLPQPGRR